MYRSRCLPSVVVLAGVLPALMSGPALGAPGEGGRTYSGHDWETTHGFPGDNGMFRTGVVDADVIGGTGGQAQNYGEQFPGGDHSGQNGGGVGGPGGLLDGIRAGGGGGGGEALRYTGNLVIAEGVTVQGGHGGKGGGGPTDYELSVEPGYGGNGGDAISGSGGDIRVEGHVLGGAGGEGGTSFTGLPGGSAGRGLFVTNANVEITATGTVRGGQGGKPGRENRRPVDAGRALGGNAIEGSGLTIRNFGLIHGGDAQSSPVNQGGHGIVGSDLVVMNAGRIYRGVVHHASRVVHPAHAILFTGGTNRLHLASDAGEPQIGTVKAQHGDNTLVLDGAMTPGGSTTATLDVSSIGDFRDFTGRYVFKISGFNAFEKRGNSTWHLTGSGAQPWDVIEGTLVGDTSSLQGDIDNDARLVFDQSITGSYAGSLSGSGTLEKSGDGTLTLSGDFADFSGDTLVSDGLLVAGNRADFTLVGGVTVAEQGSLGGIGTLGDTVVHGVHAPGRDAQGDSVATQRVDGDYTNHGTLSVSASPDGLDQVVVAGQADIEGATLELVPASDTGWASENGPFVIIDSQGAGAVAGTFSEVTDRALFLDAHVAYDGGDGNDVAVALRRNDVAFGAHAHTATHGEVAASIEALGEGHPLWHSMIASTDISALHAGLESLSGELYGSTQSALVNNGFFLRAAANNRVRGALSDTALAAPPALSFAQVEGGQTGLATGGTAGFWAAGYGARAETEGSGGAAAMDPSAGGFLIGADAPLGAWRVGLLAGYGTAEIDTDGPGMSSRSSDYHLGAYAGRHFGALAVRGGLAYTWHDIEASRDVFINGFSDDLTAEYGAGTLQAFGEVGYRIDAPGATFEPFVNFAHVSHDAEAFSESGGDAALDVAGQSMNTTFTTLGLRAETGVGTESMGGTAYASAGWQHAFGDTTPISENAFAGGSAFSIAGTGIAEDSLLLEAGLDIMLSDRAALDVSYQGQLASDHRQHGINGMLRVRF